MAGTIFNTLAEREVISCQDLAGKLDGMIRSGLQGRILRGFSNMTAQDWMDLVVFSSFGVFANVPKDVEIMIRQLREALVLYTNRQITETEINRAQTLLKLCLTAFTKKFEVSPPNFHIAMHMPESIRMFGPAHV